MEAYAALFEADRHSGGSVVTFPDFGYGVTQGENDSESMEMARALLMLTIADHMRESKPLPAPTRHRGSKFRRVELPALQASKVDLFAAFLESGLTKAEFARRSGYPKPISNACSLSGIIPGSTRSNRLSRHWANVYTSKSATQPKGLTLTPVFGVH